MTGFKTGASSDAPLNGDDESEDEEEETPETDTREGGPASADSRNLDETPEPEPAVEASTGSGLPWIYQRSSITDGREKTLQLHLQSSTLDEQRKAIAEIEQLLGESVKKADLREAAVLVGFQHLDEVASQLREWGYDIE